MDKIYQKRNPTMKNFSTGRLGGFTLSELLVVILIIGVLTAVALPKYQLAVKRARFATMRPIARALADAQEVYYLENGKYATDFADLAVAPPAGGEVKSGSLVQYPHFYCTLWGQKSVYCSGGSYGYFAIYMKHSSSPYAGMQLCVGENNRQLCRSFGGQKIEDGLYEKWTMP